MPITQFCGADDDGAYAPLSWNLERKSSPFYLRDSHHGLVLGRFERNGYDDSDFYAIVWDPATSAPKSIEYATTRAWTYPCSATVDATPEVQAAYAAHCERVRIEEEARRAARQAADPTVGKDVIITAGRGPRGWSGPWIGQEARIYWRGANAFRTYYRNGYNRPESEHNQRLGLEFLDGRRAFTALLNVRVKGAPSV